MNIKQAHKALKNGQDILLKATRFFGYSGTTNECITLEAYIYGHDSRYVALKYTVECWKRDNKPFENFRLEIAQ